MANEAVWLFSSLLKYELRFPPCFNRLTYQLKAAQSGQAGSPPADSAVEKSALPVNRGEPGNPAARKESTQDWQIFSTVDSC